MNHVTIGVKPIEGSAVADSMHDAVGSVSTMWCVIDGHEVPGMLIASECETSDGFVKVSLTFAASSYALVDYRDKEKYLASAKVVE